MALLDFINNHNNGSQGSVESLPANVKEQAVEAARPAVQVADKSMEAKEVPANSAPSSTPARGRSLGWER